MNKLVLTAIVLFREDSIFVLFVVQNNKEPRVFLALACRQINLNLCFPVPSTPSTYGVAVGALSFVGEALVHGWDCGVLFSSLHPGGCQGNVVRLAHKVY